MRKLLLIAIILFCSNAFGQTPMHWLTKKASSASTCDADAQKFIDSSTVTGTDADAICNLVKQLKDSSLWTKLDIIYPFISTTAATQAWNLKDPTTFKLIFNGSWTHNASGADPAAANTAYAQTGYIPSSSGSMSTSDNHISIDITENSTGAGADNYDIGAYVGATQGMLVSPAINGITGVYFDFSAVTFPYTTTVGFWIVEKSSSAASTLYKDGVSHTSSGITTGTLPNIEMYLGNINLVGSAYTSSAAGRRMDFVTGGTKLSAAEAATLNNILVIYKTAIGR